MIICMILCVYIVFMIVLLCYVIATRDNGQKQQMSLKEEKEHDLWQQQVEKEVETAVMFKKD